MSRIEGMLAHRVDWVDVLPALVLLALDPVPVEIGEQSVDIRRADRVALPLVRIVAQQLIVRQTVRDRPVPHGLQVLREVVGERPVQVGAHQIGARSPARGHAQRLMTAPARRHPTAHAVAAASEKAG